MSLESLIRDAIGPLFDGRVYPDVAAEGSALPRAVYQQVGGIGVAYQESTLPDRENVRLQIVTWGEDRADVTALAKQVEEAILAAPDLQATPLGNRTSIYEEDTRLRGALQQFSVWAPR